MTRTHRTCQMTAHIKGGLVCLSRQNAKQDLTNVQSILIIVKIAFYSVI